MTIEQVRDEIAKLLGGFVREQLGVVYIYVAEDVTNYPISTLDGLASLWPKRWAWCRVYEYGALFWVALRDDWDDEPYPSIRDTGNEPEDRTRLLLEVLRAERNPK